MLEGSMIDYGILTQVIVVHPPGVVGREHMIIDDENLHFWRRSRTGYS
jgi:hypothetical protein